MDFNTFFFGIIIVLSLAVFLYAGKFRASEKQRNRDDKINWQSARYRHLRTILLIMVGILAVAMLARWMMS
ncbi:MAG: hypothetical protein P8O19_05065 [Woeseiaceae bacterium]|jgi:hypothetical protein|nr:hypothetical protein [Woeseiaceae bacterium]MDG1016216.1 hypothetical protein [Woeseiaceae bacterium]MDG1866032.1 hypothetical protein [Woeseiaceae bacterium]|tara:strand:+ start:2644 stop:2856 length:213 start_codon:yes stop_codon:yes gene_type:complete